jgi:hypothetical protein
LNYYYVFAVIVFIKVIINVNNYYQCKRLFRKYNNYLKDCNWSFLGYQKKIIQLFEDANIHDGSVPVVEPVGYSHVMKANVSFFQNLNNTREDIVSLTVKAFHQAFGVYRMRIIDAINPLYWIKLIVYLPKKTLSYVGLKDNNVVSNIVQLFYWATSIFVGVLSINDIEILKSIRDWINSIL